MSTLTTPFVGTEDAATRLDRIRTIYDFYQGSGQLAAAGTLGPVARGNLNALLTPAGIQTIANREQFAAWFPKLNILNAPYDLLQSVLGGDTLGIVQPTTVFSDTGGTTLQTTLGGDVRALRSQSGELFGVQTTAAQEPRFARHPASGLRNRLPNNSMEGAVVGVLGSGGALPTGWSISGMPAGTVEIVSLADKNDRPNLRVRLNGTPTGSVFLPPTPASAIPAAEGQDWTASAWVQMVAGDTTNITRVSLAVGGYDASVAPAGADIGADIKSALASDTRRTTSFQLPSTDTATVGSYLRLAASGAIDITLDISAPQLEQAASASDVQITRAGGFDVTEAGQRSVYYLRNDLIDDGLPFTLAAGTYTVARMDRTGHSLTENVVHAGGAFDLLGATARLYAIHIHNEAGGLLSAAEKAVLQSVFEYAGEGATV